VGRYDVGNPNLRKETSYELQINAQDGFITVVPTGEEYVDDEGHRMGVYRWENRNVLFWGFTPGISLTTIHGYLRLSYTHIEARTFETGDTLLYLPVPDFRLNGKIRRGPIFSKLSLRYVPEYGKLLGDIGVGVSLGRYGLTVGVFNPLNVEWREPSDPLRTPIPGRSVYLSLRGEI